jgi:hypothetical protein
VFEEDREQKMLMDLYRCARNILGVIGIPDAHISGGDFCTYSDLRMHSVRRDGAAAGRMATVVWFG